MNTDIPSPPVAPQSPGTSNVQVQLQPSDFTPEPVRLFQIDHMPIAAVHKDYAAHSTESMLPNPLAPRTSVTLRTLDDLAGYVATKADPTDPDRRPVVFCDRRSMRITAILDYHGAGKPSWLRHRASVQLEHSPQWKTWIERNNKAFTQVDFAEFIEDNLADIHRPTGAELLTVAENLIAVKTETFKSGRVLQNGDFEFSWTNETRGDVSTKVPKEFSVAIPVWDRSKMAVEIPVTLRYRVEGGQLYFVYKLKNPDRVVDRTWDGDCDALLSAMRDTAQFFQGVPPAEVTPLAFPQA